jgi:hypothetical protein
VPNSGLRFPLAAIISAAFAMAAPAQAQNIERPPSFDPARIPGIKATGSNYTIAKPVGSDGFMRIYVVKTRLGDNAVIGDALMRQRMVEMAALAELTRISNSDSFNKALVDAGVAPIKFAGELVTNPGQTISNTLSGIGSLFGQIGSGLNNAGKTPDDPMQSLLGVTRKRRELAIHLGVDPYTDYEPLAAQMTRLSEAAAAGGLVVTGALMAIPGVGGIIVTNTATSSNISKLARDNTAAQLMDINRKKIADMGVDNATAEVLLTNRAFTPLDVTVIVASLESMSAVQNRGAFIARASSVNRHDAAFFMRKQAELISDYYAKTGAFTSFVTLGGYPFNVTRQGGIMSVLPIDALSWTENTAHSMKDIADQAKRLGYAGKAEMKITGTSTPLARKKLKEFGWTVTDNYK